MRVIKEEAPEGVLETLTFRQEDESLQDFRTAVKKWLKDKTSIGWEEFFDRLQSWEDDRIIISMT